MIEFDYEESRLENVQIRTYHCGKCNLPMGEVSRKESACPTCGKEGWDVTYQCPVCGEKVVAFRQDLTHPPFCYCDNP